MAGPASVVRSRARDLRTRTPLHVQLVALLLLLTLAAVTVTSLVSTRALRGYLIEQKDDQVTAEAQRHVRPYPDDRGGGHGGKGDVGFDLDERNAIVSLWFDDAGVAVQPYSPELRPGVAAPELPEMTDERGRELDGTHFYVPAEDGGPPWRATAVATDVPVGTVFVAVPTRDVDDTVDRLLVINLLVGLGVLALLGLLATYAVRAGLRPLRQVQTTAEAIAAGDLTRRVPDPDAPTEVGRLARSFNTMVERIEAAFSAQRASEAQARASEDRMRRFVGDASHELRTPLTSIRGFAELHRLGAVPPAELPRVMARIEDEAKRMGLLVEDLLLLARLDQQRPLQRTPVDLLALAADAVHDATALGAGTHTAHLHIAPGTTHATVTGDEPRLRQVLTNLVANAVAHTPPGTRIDLTVSTDATHALVEVRDDGPGMPDEVASRVFERFYRADSSRTRAHGTTRPTTGSGLGLSIVAALVAAHAGTVELRTTPGQGAAFLLRLPLAPAAAPAR